MNRCWLNTEATLVYRELIPTQHNGDIPLNSCSIHFSFIWWAAAFHVTGLINVEYQRGCGFLGKMKEIENSEV
jgi:hypothetical protein